MNGTTITNAFFQIYDLKAIAIHYMKGFLAIDFVATVPFDRLFGNVETDVGANRATKLTRLPRLMKFLRIIRLLKLLRIYRLQQFIRNVEANYNIHHGISRMLNIIIVVLLATHFVGCLWYWFGIEGDYDEAKLNCFFNQTLEDGDLEFKDVFLEGGWVCREGMMDSGEGLNYVASLYWAFSTLTTVGYGDISARTSSEQAFSMIMMLMGVSWYAYVVGSMSTIMSSFDRQNKQVREKMLAVNTFIMDAKLEPELAIQVRSYFEYSLSKRNNGLSTYDADEILSELSSSLKNDVITHVEADLISSVPFFKGKSRSFVADCIQMFQPMVVQEGDFIIKEGTAADEMYFLIKGRANVYYGVKKIKALVEGSYFGEIGCIIGGIRRAGIRAVTTCELQCLSKRNLNMLLAEYPDVGDDLKAIARDRMKAVRTTAKLKTVNSIRKFLEVRETRLQEGEVIPAKMRLSDVGSIEENGRGGLVAFAEVTKLQKEEPAKDGANQDHRVRSMTSNFSGGGIAQQPKIHAADVKEDVVEDVVEDNVEDNNMFNPIDKYNKISSDKLSREIQTLIDNKINHITTILTDNIESHMISMLQKATNETTSS